MSPIFVAIEGPDGTGKSTLAKALAEDLDAILVREPGGTVISERIRTLVKDPDLVLNPRAEALLFAAARAQLAAEVIVPALASGRAVVADRWRLSSLVYQGVIRQLGVDAVASLSSFALDGVDADVTLYLDAPDDVLASRFTGRGTQDRMEATTVMGQVAAAYRQLAPAHPGALTVNASGSPAEVLAAARAALRTRA